MFTDNNRWMVIVGGNWNGDKSRHYFQLTDENMNIRRNVLPMVLINACVSCKFMTELDDNEAQNENENEKEEQNDSNDKPNSEMKSSHKDYSNNNDKSQ